MFVLTPHGTDTFVGIGPQYPWGGLYGGQIVAQALRAASATLDPLDHSTDDTGFVPHSIRAYFIRRGDHTEPIRYEVDRIRNGRSFVTRRVVARQATGAILNAECSFQRPEASQDIAPIAMPVVPPPAALVQDSWSEVFDRCMVPAERIEGPRLGAGRVAAWMRVTAEVPRGVQSHGHFLDECWLAYLSDDMPTDAVRAAHQAHLPDDLDLYGTSLDHTIWFHRPLRADMWHLFDVTCHHFVSGRGLTVGHVFDAEGVHVATCAQEVLLRVRR